MKKTFVVIVILVLAVAAGMAVYINTVLQNFEQYSFMPVNNYYLSTQVSNVYCDSAINDYYAFRLYYPELKHETADTVIKSFVAHCYDEYKENNYQYTKKGDLFKKKYVPALDGDFKITYGKNGYYSVIFIINERDLYTKDTSIRKVYYTFDSEGNNIAINDLFVGEPVFATEEFYMSGNQIMYADKEGVFREYTIDENNKETIFYVEPPVVEKPNKPRVAITFDDGPSSNTRYLIKELAKRDVKVTFFMQGVNAERNKQLVKDVYDAGHLIGSHSYGHKSYNKMTDSELAADMKKVNNLLYDITGETIRYVRPPYGTVTDALKKQQVCIINWNIDTLDWKTKDEDKSVQAVKKNIKDGSIILFHDLYEPSVKAALRIIDMYKDEYDFVRVDELLTDNEGNAAPVGVVYRHG